MFYLLFGCGRLWSQVIDSFRNWILPGNDNMRFAMWFWAGLVRSAISNFLVRWLRPIRPGSKVVRPRSLLESTRQQKNQEPFTMTVHITPLHESHICLQFISLLHAKSVCSVRSIKFPVTELAVSSVWYYRDDNRSSW